jgi:hypothetical protein
MKVAYVIGTHNDKPVATDVTLEDGSEIPVLPRPKKEEGDRGRKDGEEGGDEARERGRSSGKPQAAPAEGEEEAAATKKKRSRRRRAPSGRDKKEGAEGEGDDKEAPVKEEAEKK